MRWVAIFEDDPAAGSVRKDHGLRAGHRLYTWGKAPLYGRGTAEQWIKEGKTVTHWTRLSCHRFRANEVRLLLGVIAYNLGNRLRRLVLPVTIQNWSLTSLQQRLFKTGGRLIRHARYFTPQLAESYLTRSLFQHILTRIERLAWHPT